MKPILYFILMTLLFLLSPLAQAQSFTYHDGYHLGQEEALSEGGIQWGWLFGGFAGGSLLNILGGGGIVTLAYFNEANLDSQTLKELERRPISYSLGYREGYQSIVRGRKMRHATIGAGVGVVLNTTALVLIYLMYYY